MLHLPGDGLLDRDGARLFEGWPGFTRPALAHNCKACVNNPAKACKCRLQNSASVLGVQMFVGREAAKRTWSQVLAWILREL
ncbi:MAG: hypothetical protein ACYCOX_15475 [Acidobacteriaceae bacterium]